MGAWHFGQRKHGRSRAGAALIRTCRISCTRDSSFLALPYRKPLCVKKPPDSAKAFRQDMLNDQPKKFLTLLRTVLCFAPSILTGRAVDVAKRHSALSVGDDVSFADDTRYK